MSTNYIINYIRTFLLIVYGLKAEISQIDTFTTRFNLGNVGAFDLNTNAFKNDADLIAFKLDLSSRLNTALTA